MSLPSELLDRERQFAAAFRRAALDGVRLDPAQVEKLTAEHTEAREASRRRAEALSDGQITNPKSNPQVGPCLAERGYQLPHSPRTGRPGAGKGVLEPLAEAGDELAKALLAYRHADTALGLLLDPRTELIRHGDGRVRTSILTLSANTGRTSSRNENLQQVSRQGGMRACHLAEPGCMVVSADFASVEVRVGAALSGDEGLKRMIAMGDLYPDRKKEFDLHWIAAQTVFGKDATKEDRYNSKRYIFRRMYGGEPVTPVMQQVFAAFNQIAPGYAAWDQVQRNYARTKGAFFQAYSGRVIWLPKNAEHAAGNYMIQGTAREFLVDAVAKWQRGKWADHVIIPVHDEVIVFDIPEDEADAATAFLVECMTTSINGVSIIAEANPPSPFWLDAS
jgi:DNA polymerase I-like protein with 3'-5' exonuclease and polymerase domains